MSKRMVNKIMQGIGEARDYLEGTADKHRYRVHVPETAGVRRKTRGRPPKDVRPLKPGGR
jgi:hypothetical protein